MSGRGAARGGQGVRGSRRRANDTSSHTELVYYVIRDRKPVRAITVVNLIHNYDIQELAVALSQVIHIQAEGRWSIWWQR